MTTQELRELDAWIAEHVMGWKITKYHCCGEQVERLKPSSGDLHANIRNYSPTTDPSAAMDVLKKCSQMKFDVSINHFDAKNLNLLIGLKEWSVLTIGFEAQAETLELAICLFAKKLFTK